MTRGLSPAVGAYGGAEYLITPKLGLAVDLGMNLTLFSIDSPLGGRLFSVRGNLSVVLHQ